MELWLSSRCTWIPIPFLNVTKIVVSWPFLMWTSQLLCLFSLPFTFLIFGNFHSLVLIPWILIFLLQLVMIFLFLQANAHHLACVSITPYIWVTVSKVTKRIHFPYLILNLQEPNGLDLIKNLCLKLISLTLRRQHLLFTGRLQALMNRSINADPVMKNIVFST